VYYSKLSLSRWAGGLAANPYALHQRLADAFPAGHVHCQRTLESGYLFSVLGGVIHLQSAIQPDFDRAFQRAGHLLTDQPEVREQRLSFVVGESRKFRLKTIPVKSYKVEEGMGRRGRRTVLTDPDDVMGWLDSRAAEWGLETTKLFCRAMPRESGHKHVLNGGKPSVLELGWTPYLYEGVLKVVSPELITNAVIRGVGPHKGLGYGMIMFL
jgi:hypothetical protein